MVRTDSHDGAVPRPVAMLLRKALQRCPAVEVVFLERRADTLTTAEARARWRADFLDLRAMVDAVWQEDARVSA